MAFEDHDLGTSAEQSHKILKLQQSIADASNRLFHTTTAFIREHPWKAIAIAAGLGLAVGCFFRDREE